MTHDDSSLELVLHDEIQELLDNFAILLNTHIAFFNAEGDVLLRGRSEGVSPCCQWIQQRFGVDSCKKLDQKMLRLARVQNCGQTYRCPLSGLWEVLVPIQSGGELLGGIMFGQLRKKGDVCPSHNDRRFLRLFRERPVFSEERIQKLSGLLQLLADTILSRELIRIGRNHLLGEVKKYIDTHYREEIYVSDAARHTRRSVSSLSHSLRNEYGTTFKKLLLERRFQHVENAWKENPHISLKQAIQEAGFNDSNYFSRIYRKHRGRTFSEFAKEC